VSGRRAVVFTLATWAGLIVVASLQALSPWRLPTPEVALLVVLYLGLGGRGTTPAHVGVALAIGYLADLFAGSPKGLESLTLAVAMVLARAASSRLDVTTPWHTLVIAAVATVGHALVLLALSSTMYHGDALAAWSLAPETALATALVAPFVFSLLARIDRQLMPDPRALRMS
jgi:rod shape-determining protein MreD